MINVGRQLRERALHHRNALMLVGDAAPHYRASLSKSASRDISVIVPSSGGTRKSDPPPPDSPLYISIDSVRAFPIGPLPVARF